MVPYDPTPHDLQVGLAFNKEHLWPGFRWFTLGEHVHALERNGFEIRRAVNLSQHYAKTTAAWYERMMFHRNEMVDLVATKRFGPSVSFSRESRARSRRETFTSIVYIATPYEGTLAGLSE